MRRLPVIALMVAMGSAIAVSAHFRPDRAALKQSMGPCYIAACPAFHPVQSNYPELTVPTPGANALVPGEQADCIKAGQSTKYGTNADCRIPSSGGRIGFPALPQTGTGFADSNGYAQAVGSTGNTTSPHLPIQEPHHSRGGLWLMLVVDVVMLVVVIPEMANDGRRGQV